MEKFIFTTLNSDSEIPYQLLLLADETVEAINKYIFNCTIHIIKDGTKDIAVMALHKNSDIELEIKNIAVIESYRSQGIGSILINKAKEIALQNHYSSLLVGTSDTGFRQIRFYERNGFMKKAVLTNFFIENYPYPIYENGKQMKDMIVLVHHLSE